jgi:hypothetical protein
MGLGKTHYCGKSCRLRKQGSLLRTEEDIWTYDEVTKDWIELYKKELV